MDRDYWVDQTSFFGSKNHIRAIVAAKTIEGLEVNSIIDLGCGDQYIRNLINKNIRYTPVDMHRRSTDCLVYDVENNYPDGNWDLTVTLGVTQHIHNKDQLYDRISKSTKYWITSISNTGDLIKEYNSTQLKQQDQKTVETTIDTMKAQMSRFNLLKSIRCSTGCLICLWIRKDKKEIEYIRRLNDKERSLGVKDKKTRQLYLEQHIKQRRKLHEYIGFLHSEITGQKPESMKRINLTIDGKLMQQLKLINNYICSSSCSEYIHFSIGYCYNNNNIAQHLNGNFSINEWLSMFEKLFENKFCKMYIGLSPTYEVYTIYKLNKQ